VGEIVAQPVVACAEPECLRPGKWRPIIHVFWEKGKIPGEAVLKNMTICDEHRDEASKDIVDNDDCWTEIGRNFTGYGRLVREKTKVSYEAV
jgi:hypothetical protein